MADVGRADVWCAAAGTGGAAAAAAAAAARRWSSGQRTSQRFVRASANHHALCKVLFTCCRFFCAGGHVCPTPAAHRVPLD